MQLSESVSERNLSIFKNLAGEGPVKIRSITPFSKGTYRIDLIIPAALFETLAGIAALLIPALKLHTLETGQFHKARSRSAKHEIRRAKLEAAARSVWSRTRRPGQLSEAEIVSDIAIKHNLEEDALEVFYRKSKRDRQHRLADRRNKRIALRRKEGMAEAEIANRFRLSISGVRSILKKRRG